VLLHRNFREYFNKSFAKFSARKIESLKKNCNIPNIFKQIIVISKFWQIWKYLESIVYNCVISKLISFGNSSGRKQNIAETFAKSFGKISRVSKFHQNYNTTKEQPCQDIELLLFRCPDKIIHLLHKKILSRITNLKKRTHNE